MSFAVRDSLESDPALKNGNISFSYSCVQRRCFWVLGGIGIQTLVLHKFVAVFIKYQAPIQSNNDARFEACAFFNQTLNIALKQNNNQKFAGNIISN